MRRERAMAMVSSKPAVVSKPARTPCFSTRALVTAVVPRPNRATLPRKSSRLRPICSATSRQAPITPRPKFCGSVGDFARHNCVPPPTARSVNVPPTSIPIANPLEGGPGTALTLITLSLSWSRTLVRKSVDGCSVGSVEQHRSHRRARREGPAAGADDRAGQPHSRLHVDRARQVRGDAAPRLGKAEARGGQFPHRLVGFDRHVDGAARIDGLPLVL